MNITKARKSVQSKLKKERYLKYDNDNDVEEGDTIYIYARRFMKKGKSRWRVESVSPTVIKNIGGDIELDKGRQQLILKMTIDMIGTRKNKFSDVSVKDRSKIVKDKEYILDTIIQLWRTGWETKYITDSRMVRDIDGYSGQTIRPIQKDDFKITTVWSQSKAMHLGHASHDKDYMFKLGVNWVYWHRKNDTRRLKTLTHEICHCRRPHHKELFFQEHAEFISKLYNSESRRERVEKLFDDEINWSELKARALEGVHNQPKEIDITGHQNRRSACNAVVERLEDVLSYDYEMGRALYIYPEERIYDEWTYNSRFGNMDCEKPDNFELKKFKHLNYNDTYTDEELYEFYQNCKSDTHSTFSETVIKKENIPVVECNDVVENDITVALYDKMRHHSKFKGLSNSVKVPVKIKS